MKNQPSRYKGHIKISQVSPSSEQPFNHSPDCIHELLIVFNTTKDILTLIFPTRKNLTMSVLDCPTLSMSFLKILQKP